MKSKILSQLRLLTICLILFFTAGVSPLISQDFNQKIEWSADPNVLEYKVDVQDKSGKIIKSITTENNSINLSLGEGRYKYRITAYDFLGREAVSTKWIDFEVVIAKQPAIEHKKEREALKEDGKGLEIAVNVDDVTKDTSVELVNVETGEKISGKLNVAENKAAASSLSASETYKADKVQFDEVPEGNWKLVITNPSGLSSETESFEVKDVIKEEKLAAQKAEEERIAREKKAEEERLAREEAERKERERLEAERLAREEEERLERERIAAEIKAREEAERLERERIAEEIKAREEAEKQERLRIAEEIRAREEAERLAREQAEREEAERLARVQAEREEAERKEAERLAKEEEAAAKKAARAEKRKKPALGIEAKIGAGMVMNILDTDLADFNNTDSLTDNNLPEEFKLAPYASISYVPNLNWKINPGFEIRYHSFRLEHIEDSFKSYEYDDYEFQQSMNFYSIQGTFIGQINLVSQRVLFNAKLGGGLSYIYVFTDYIRARSRDKKVFLYPLLGTGLSVELLPFKHFVLEIGADYDIILSDKINYSYPMPYLTMGVRF